MSLLEAWGGVRWFISSLVAMDNPDHVVLIVSFQFCGAIPGATP
jgi:hypothetical protein